MSEARTTIIKIGGSVITDKNTELTPRTQTIDRLAGEIQEAAVKNLLIVHGGGSFGHPSAERNAIKQGFKNSSQIMGLVETHHFMTVLNGLIMDSLITHNLPAIAIMPSSCVVTNDGRIRSFESTPLEMLLKMGFSPVLYGDAVPDVKLGFTVLSGDQLVSALATRLGAQRIIVGVDVDGLFDADPKVEKMARRFSHLSLDELRQIQGSLGKSTACDVTGGMFGKILELLPALEQGIPVTILNATKPGRVCDALKGICIEGTLIEKE